MTLSPVLWVAADSVLRPGCVSPFSCIQAPVQPRAVVSCVRRTQPCSSCQILLGWGFERQKGKCAVDSWAWGEFTETAAAKSQTASVVSKRCECSFSTDGRAAVRISTHQIHFRNDSGSTLACAVSPSPEAFCPEFQGLSALFFPSFFFKSVSLENSTKWVSTVVAS